MGCSSSTQTAGQEGRRPSTKTDESNGAGAFGNYNEIGNTPEDEDIVGSSPPDDDLLQASSEKPQVQATDSPETQAELPDKPTSVETLAQASGDPQPPEGDAVDAPAECAAADQGDVMDLPSQETQSPAAEGGETEEVVAKETGTDGATEVANTGEAAAASEE